MAEVIISETGPQGPPGMNWKGNYDSTVAYNITDGVFYAGSSYICIQPVTAIAPTGLSNDPYWQIFAGSGPSGGFGLSQTLRIVGLRA